jgi:hypothetical protein
MSTLTVGEILDRWQGADLDEVASDVPDQHVWLFALMATSIAGKRAQTQGLEKYEEACAEFARIFGEPLGLSFDECAGGRR